MSATDFLPRREVDLRTWSNIFQAKIAADPIAYGLTALQAADYVAKHDAFVAAYQVANEPLTRSPTYIRAKDIALSRLRAAARQLAGIIRATRSVTDEQKSGLGLTVRRAGGKSPRIPRPSDPPRIHVLSAVGRSVTIRLRDRSAPTRRGRPIGVRGATIFSFLGDQPPKELAGWRYHGMTTRTEVEVTFPPSAPNGATVWVTAFWYNPRMQDGPASQAISTQIPGGFAVAA